MPTYTVGELASMAGITVRTLHHYDEIGLLESSPRSPGGYRIYDEARVERLRAILTYRDLGLSLEETATAIDGDADSVLRLARDRVFSQIARLDKIAASLSRSLAENNNGEPMTNNDKLRVFEGFEPSEYVQEAESRWGDTSTYHESIRRTNSYDEEDWATIRAEIETIYGGFVALMKDRVPPGAPQTRSLVDEHRDHISRWYYDCSPEIHQGLGQLYAADPRFKKNIDSSGEGLAAYLSVAIAAAYGTA
jgi:MerR family transcriptional regulator, thiopeptide resistance regulator